MAVTDLRDLQLGRCRWATTQFANIFEKMSRVRGSSGETSHIRQREREF
jgi:hypothetical protein